MTEKNNYRILIIDDVAEIHQDFRKILLSSEDSESQKYLKSMNAKFFGDDKGLEKSTLPPFEIDFAFQGHEGLKLIKQALVDNRPYALTFVDVQMPPGDDGVNTIIEMWKMDSDIQTVICTAYAKYSWEDLQRIFGETDRLFILKKPFDPIEVVQLASSLTKKWNMNKEVNDLLLKLKSEKKSIPKKTNDKSEQTDFSWDSLKKATDALLEFNKKLQEKKINPPNQPGSS